MRPGVRKLFAILGVCLVFALGIVAGAAVTIRVVRHRAESLLTKSGSDLATDRLARRLANELHSDASQREQIGAVLHSAHGEMWEVRREATPRVLDIYRRAVARIRGILRPDQTRAFDEIVARQTARLHLDDAASLPPTAGGTPTPDSP